MAVQHEQLVGEAALLADGGSAAAAYAGVLCIHASVGDGGLPATAGETEAPSPSEGAAIEGASDPTVDEYAQRYDAKRGLSLKGLPRLHVLATLQAEAVRRERAMDPRSIAFELEPDDINGFLHPPMGESAQLDEPGATPFFGLNPRAQFLSPTWIAEAEAHYGQGFVREALWPTYAWEDVRDNFVQAWGSLLKPVLTEDQLRLAYTAVYHVPDRTACWAFFDSPPTFGEMRREAVRVGQLAVQGPGRLPIAAETARKVDTYKPGVSVTHDQFRAAWRGALRPKLADGELALAFGAIFSPDEGHEHDYWRYMNPGMHRKSVLKLIRHAEDRRIAGPEAVPQQAAEINARQWQNRVFRAAGMIAHVIANILSGGDSKPTARAA